MLSKKSNNNNFDDEVKFNNIVKKYERKLYYIAFSILKTHTLAEDAVWMAFFRFSKKMEIMKNEPYYKIEYYLYKTIKSVSFDIYKTEYKFLFLTDNNVDFEQIYDEKLSYSDNNDILDLINAVENLEDKYKKVIIYIFYHSLPAHHIGKMIGVSRKIVYKYRDKALAILADELTDHSSDDNYYK